MGSSITLLGDTSAVNPKHEKDTDPDTPVSLSECLILIRNRLQ